MDKSEARNILTDFMKQYRRRSYQDIMLLINKEEIHEIRTESGKFYQLEFQAFYDDSIKQNIRVLGSIDDGGIRSLAPMCDDFIISPDGTFIGE